ncbi:MAG: biopolymer transporter ExbD [Pirellulaceae bacterium]|nr:biopolymer transporter ExbD [Pirellulaceae bacterium]
MRLSSNKTKKILECDLTPMIDMTFQLIAFFMVLINFTRIEHDEKIQLPQSELAKPPLERIEHSLTLQLTHDGIVILSGKEVPLENISPHLTIEANLLKQFGSVPQEATVIIRAHKEAPTGTVQELIAATQEKKFQNFILRAKEKVY